MFLDATVDDDIRTWLLEDIPYWDISSRALADTRLMQAKIIAKSDGMISGLSICARIFELVDLQVIPQKVDGDLVQKGDTILLIEGMVSKILQAERVALNILCHMSGITNKTNHMIKLLRNNGLRTMLAATRKTLPGLRKYEKYAVLIGGGDTHRLDLSAMALIKENHIRAFGGIDSAVNHVKNQISFSQKIEIEVTNAKEALQAAETPVDIVMFDNFTPAEIKEVLPQLKKINPNLLTEASGNISEDTIIAYAESGVDIVSMGSLTHSVRSFDFSLLVIE